MEIMVTVTKTNKQTKKNPQTDLFLSSENQEKWEWGVRVQNQYQTYTMR